MTEPTGADLDRWIDAVSDELGVAGLVDRATARDLLLDLARDVAHGVARPAAPVTAFLLGLAAGRSGDPQATAVDLAERVRRLAAGWPQA